jgi:hypothetical protein
MLQRLHIVWLLLPHSNDLYSPGEQVAHVVQTVFDEGVQTLCVN